jgi:hypothetical protein
VKVILALPTSISTKTQTNEISDEGNSSATTSETKGNSAENITTSDEKTKTLLKTSSCIMGEANDISCVSSDGFSFLIEAATGNTISGDSKKKA